MGGGASAPRAQTLDELLIGDSSEESSDEDNLLQTRRDAKKKKPKWSKPTIVKAKKGKKKLPRNVVTAEMRWEIPERYKYPQPEGFVETIKDPVDGKLQLRTRELKPGVPAYPLGGPSTYSAFWRGRLGPLNDTLNLDGTLKKQKRPAHGGIRGAPKDKWADGGAKMLEKEARKNMTEKEKRELRKQEKKQAARKAAGGSGSNLGGSGTQLALQDGGSPRDSSPSSSPRDGDESPKKSSASFRFKSPSRFFGKSFKEKPAQDSSP